MKKQLMEKHLIVFFLFVITFTLFSSMDIYLTFAPKMADQLGVMRGVLKFSFLIGPLTSLIISYPIGKYINQKPLRWVYFISVTIFIIGCLYCYSCVNIESFLFGRLLQSMAMSAIGVTNTFTFSKLFQGRKLAKIMSWYSALYAIIFLCAPVIGYLFDQFGNWRWTFLMPAILSALILIPLLIILPKQKTDSEVYSFFIKKTSRINYHLILATLPGSVGAIFAIEAPFIYKEQLFISDRHFIFIQCLPLIFQIGGTLIYQRSMKRISAAQSFKIGKRISFMLTLLLIWNFFSGNPFLLLGAVCVFQAGLSFLTATSSSLYLDTKGDGKSIKSSFLNITRNIILVLFMTLTSFVLKMDLSSMSFLLILIFFGCIWSINKLDLGKSI